jgi:hypothetical protein
LAPRNDFVARSHQLALEGFEWFFDRRLVTMWSPPDYMYFSGNETAVLKCDPERGAEGYEIVEFDECPPDRRMVPEDPAYFTQIDEERNNGCYLWSNAGATHHR